MEGVVLFDGLKFRRDKKSGYYLCTKAMEGRRPRLHRYVWEKENGKIPEGYEVHHIDGDKDNNELSNLAILPTKKHKSLHANDERNRFYQRRERNLELARGKAKEWHKSEEGLKWHSEQAKQNYQKRKPKKQTCLYCGVEYESTKYGAVKFCSPNCQSQYRVKSGADDVKRECVVCGTQFMINKYRKTKTCSLSCRSKLIHINRSK